MIKRKIVASIEARMTSTRLPGKVLMEALKGISMLEFMIDRLKKTKLIDEIIVATTTNKTDNIIVELCNKLKIKYYRGSENDVLMRVLEAHKLMKTDIVVELTGDCPLIDPNIIDKLIAKYLEFEYDYVSNSHVRSYPAGFDVQVFSYKLLKKISLLTDDPYDRENVSSFIYRSGIYSTYAYIADLDEFWPELRVTLDDHGDYLLIKNIIDYFYSIKNKELNVKNVVKYLKQNNTLLKLNKNARVTESPYQTIANSPNEKKYL